VDFFDVRVAYDAGGNVLSLDDRVHAGFDVKATNDGLHRLSRAEEGTLVSGSITSRTRDELWTLSQTGNFAVTRLDLDGDGDFTGSGEHDDTRTHNVVNELLARDTDSDTNDDVTLGYDAVGNLVDDGEQYTYVYDAFGRLRRMRTQGDDDYAEFTYNGLDFKTSQVFDTDSDGDLGDETVERQVYDAGWRIVAVYRGDAADPYEQYVWHNAGMGGFGGSSYVDALILRDRDADLDQNAVLEERLYYCQSWRADVVAVVDSTGTLVEGARYSAYGVPIGVPAGDTNTDLTFDSTDSSAITGWSPPASYDVRYDVNLDGAITSADAAAAATVTLGRGVLSSAAIDNRRGYAGYEFWPAPAANLWSVRHRVLHSDLGRWTRRDPLGHVDGMNLYVYARNRTSGFREQSGVASEHSSATCSDDGVAFTYCGPPGLLIPPRLIQYCTAIEDLEECVDCCDAAFPDDSYIENLCISTCVHRPTKRKPADPPRTKPPTITPRPPTDPEPVPDLPPIDTGPSPSCFAACGHGSAEWKTGHKCANRCPTNAFACLDYAKVCLQKCLAACAADESKRRKKWHDGDGKKYFNQCMEPWVAANCK
jgi:RHS repeat-associated protein